MRVIQHKSLSRQKARSGNRLLRLVFVVFLLCLAFIGNYFYTKDRNYLDNTQKTKELAIVAPKEKVFRSFSDEELKNLYNNFNYANTDKITTAPSITGDEAADAKIRLLAETRGYQLRRLARSLEAKADGFPLQRLAEKSWNDLKAAAAKEGVILTVTSAFRTIEDQQAIFAQGLAVHGISTQDISSGRADDLVDKVLQTYAPPGYSRHHTGFTIDLTCGTAGLTNFATTVCHEWLSRDNYLHAKTFGWVPSYPEGASLQGPEPEPWEYIWVTIDSLIK